MGCGCDGDSNRKEAVLGPILATVRATPILDSLARGCDSVAALNPSGGGEEHPSPRRPRLQRLGGYAFANGEGENGWIGFHTWNRFLDVQGPWVRQSVRILEQAWLKPVNDCLGPPDSWSFTHIEEAFRVDNGASADPTVWPPPLAILAGKPAYRMVAGSRPPSTDIVYTSEWGAITDLQYALVQVKECDVCLLKISLATVWTDGCTPPSLEHPIDPSVGYIKISQVRIGQGCLVGQPKGGQFRADTRDDPGGGGGAELQKKLDPSRWQCVSRPRYDGISYELSFCPCLPATGVPSPSDPKPKERPVTPSPKPTRGPVVTPGYPRDGVPAPQGALPPPPPTPRGGMRGPPSPPVPMRPPAPIDPSEPFRSPFPDNRGPGSGHPLVLWSERALDLPPTASPDAHGFHYRGEPPAGVDPAAPAPQLGPGPAGRLAIGLRTLGTPSPFETPSDEG
jgi:hypothetical protein